MNTIKKLRIWLFTIIEWSIKILTLIFIITIIGISIYMIFQTHLSESIIKELVSLKYLLLIPLAYDIWNFTKNKGLIFGLNVLFKIIIGSLIYDYYRSKNYIKNLNVKEGFKSLLNPFITKIYFDLKEVEKINLKNYKDNLFNLYENTNSYFQNIFSFKSVNITSIKKINNNYDIRLYYSKFLESKKIEGLSNKDILKGIGLSIEKYSLNVDIKNDIRLLISKKENTKNYLLKDCISDFKKDSILFGYDDLGKPLFYDLDFNYANHFGVYGGTGSGKTNFTSSIIFGFLHQNPDYNYIIMDLKGDLNAFQGLENVRYEHTVDGIIKLAEEVSINMTHVNNIFFNSGVRNYNEYKNKSNNHNDIKPTIIFLEEFSYLLKKIDDKFEKQTDGSAAKKRLIDIVSEIALAGRSAAHSLFFSLQTPLIKIIGNSEITRQMKNIVFNIDIGSQSKYILKKNILGSG